MSGSEPKFRHLLQEPLERGLRRAGCAGRGGATVFDVPGGLGQPGSRQRTRAVEQHAHETDGKLGGGVDRLGRHIVVMPFPHAVLVKDCTDVVAAAL
jgi:hypothetical protein